MNSEQQKTLIFRVSEPATSLNDEGFITLSGEPEERPHQVTRAQAKECARLHGARFQAVELQDQSAAGEKEMARQAFLAGAELAGVDLEDPEREFAAFWERQVDYAVDASSR